MPTTTNTIELQRRGPGRPPKGLAGRRTFASDFAFDFFPRLHASYGVRFPSPIYRDDPVRFAREILGVDPWHKQVEILEAVRDHQRVAVKSGHKVGKSHSAGMLALWFYCSYPAARVVMSSTTSRQVDEILWRQLRMLYATAGRCLECTHELRANPAARIPRPCPHSSLISGELGDLARTGLKSDDFREIVGFTAKQAEAVAGISGEHVLYILDEASGIPRVIYEAIEGNRAGSAKLALFGNPTKNEGEFYDAFNSKARFYKGITVSSEETPNALAHRIVIPGLAASEWLEEKKDEWGENSPLYKVRVKGEFAEYEEGKIFSLHEIAQSEQRWRDSIPAEGRLYIGVDPAGEKGSGDEIVFASRRGLRCLDLRIRRGLDETGHLTELLNIIEDHRLPRETPVAVLDRGGDIGSKVYIKIRDYAEENPGALEVVGVRPSDDSMRQPELYPKMRDALAASLSAWFLAGGAIPEDTKLEKELHAMQWHQRADGKLKLTDKPTLRKILGRSPDRYDALALSVWEPLSLRDRSLPPPRETERDYYAGRRAMDPYEGLRRWERR
jgi:phage terminase large subunit